MVDTGRSGCMIQHPQLLQKSQVCFHNEGVRDTAQLPDLYGPVIMGTVIVHYA